MHATLASRADLPEFGPETIRIEPQPGPQTLFLSTPADIAIYGGAAGGGKTFALLTEPVRHLGNPRFGAVIFRRTTVQVKNKGGLWEESTGLYPLLGGAPKSHVLAWVFPTGATVQFAHLEHEKTVLNWQGSQIPLIGFDELTHFTEYQFWYLVSRNRSMCGVRPYIRATCNPDADSWVADFIAWWIDQKTGYAIPERAGVLRWFVRVNDAVVWADRPEDLAEYTMVDPDDPTRLVPIPPKSVTFIPAKLEDNAAMARVDPGYRANLMALPAVERERLLAGNWKIRRSGTLFNREDFEIVDSIPMGGIEARAWDFAATEKSLTAPDPDWTVGLKGKRVADGTFYITGMYRKRAKASVIASDVKNIATQDGRSCRIRIPQDPAQAGKDQVEKYVTLLAGWPVTAKPVSGDKVTRADPAATQAGHGKIKLARGDWNDTFLAEVCAFPSTVHHDDIVDALSDLIDELTNGSSYTLDHIV